MHYYTLCDIFMTLSFMFMMLLQCLNKQQHQDQIMRQFTSILFLTISRLLCLIKVNCFGGHLFRHDLYSFQTFITQLHSNSTCKLCLFLCIFEFAQFIVPYRSRPHLINDFHKDIIKQQAHCICCDLARAVGCPETNKHPTIHYCRVFIGLSG